MSREPNVKILDQDPEDHFDSIAEITFDRPLCIARHKQAKGELVHIQKSESEAVTRNVLKEFNDRIPHGSFRHLLGGYRHGGMTFLLWEPVELSVEQIIAAQGIIKATEIIAIARPVRGGLIPRYRNAFLTATGARRD